MNISMPLLGGLLAALPLALFAQPAATAPEAGVGGNQPPVCDAGSDQFVLRQGATTTVTLDGSASYDPEGGPLTYLWQQGCPNGVIANPMVPITTLTFDTPPGSHVTCGVRLIVTDDQGEFSICRFFITVVDLGLDIKPGSCPNPVQTGSGGVLPVAIVAAPGFDATTIDVGTLELVRTDGVGGSVAPRRTNISDVATPFQGEGCECHELTGDGTLDLMTHFDKAAVVAALQLAGEPDKSFVSLTMRGKLLDGSDFQVRDCVRVQN